MGNTAVLPCAKKGDDVDTVAEDIPGDGQSKGTPTASASASASDSHPFAVLALNGDATKPGADIPKKKGNDAVRAAFAFAFLAASPVLRAFAAVSKLTPTRAAFLVSALLALLLSAGHPCRAVWTFTVIIISYLGLWTIYLGESIRPITVLVSLTYLMLLAISVTHLSSVAGVFLKLIDTPYAAGLFGYALGEYRLRKGSEPSAQLLVIHMNDRDLKSDKADITMASLYATIASFFFSCFPLLNDFSLFCWAGFVGVHLLHAVLFAKDHMGFILWGTVLLVLPDFGLKYLFGEAISVLVHPVSVMGVAGALGYSLGVYVCYNTQ